MPTDSTPPMGPAHPAESLRHGYYEDAQALFAGTLFVAMALLLEATLLGTFLAQLLLRKPMMAASMVSWPACTLVTLN